MVTIREIARKSGFSAATVSRLLNHDPTFSIAEDTKQHILEVAHELGYDRKEITPPQRNIAVFFAITPKEELEDIYFNNLRQNIQENAHKQNMTVTFYHDPAAIDQIATDEATDGFIAVGSFPTAILQQLQAFSSNGVFIDTNPLPESFNSVQPDLTYIVKHAIDVFRERGWERIGFIGGRSFDPDTHQAGLDERERVFRSYMQELGLLDERYIFSAGHFAVGTGYQLGQQVATNLADQLPDGFFVASDPIAVGVLQAFNETGIIVPKDTSIISVNDIDVAKYVSPPLTTFHIDIPELSRLAINLLKDDLTSTSTTKRRILVNAKMVVRKSFLPNELDGAEPR
ncbi:LacI family DNA-binding transcriptional regulator [Lapidilactobacillus salsurivasis]